MTTEWEINRFLDNRQPHRLSANTWSCGFCGGRMIDKKKHGNPTQAFSSCHQRMGRLWASERRAEAWNQGLMRPGTSHDAGRVLSNAITYRLVDPNGPGIMRVPVTVHPVTGRSPMRDRDVFIPGDRRWPFGYLASASGWFTRPVVVHALRQPWSYGTRGKLAGLLLESPPFEVFWTSEQCQTPIQAAERLSKGSGNLIVKRLLAAYV